MTTEQRITRDIARYSETDEPSHRWSMIIDGETVSELWVSIEHSEISQVETKPEHQGQGYAGALYRQAAGEMPIFHAPEAHRTPEGRRFAESVGGETIDHCTVADCYACDQNADFDDED
jgi:hypothetical protein